MVAIFSNSIIHYKFMEFTYKEELFFPHQSGYWISLQSTLDKERHHRADFFPLLPSPQDKMGPSYFQRCPKSWCPHPPAVEFSFVPHFSFSFLKYYLEFIR